MKVLIVGLGSIGRKHVDGILNLSPNAQIYALRSGINLEFYKSVINVHHKNEIPVELDFIVISNITAYHESTILDLIDFKCPMFIEKPVLSDIKNSERISNLLKDANIITYIGCNMRFHPSIEFIRGYLKDNVLRINEVNIYCGSYLPSWRPGKNFRDIYSANRKMGGGVHLDLIHEIDYCCWIFGNPISSESLQMSCSSLEIDAIDSARYFMKYLDFSTSITLNYFRRDAKRQIEIVTSEDTIIVDLLLNTIKSVIKDEILFQGDFDLLDTYTKQMSYFTKQIKLGESTMNTFDDAVKILKLAINE
ncbi:Gfo/Idh/MocA family protein [Aquirufa aurantiipilula]|uniref:Gfo/Idh/MocA family protein n=1 Tax=Aquirufa aurantiipilula TaxID=2696561 RepID=UPI001CAA622C|nr:Gfo/Idh/MocA family oxidoreductase [Aquirufa aurantiipilula]MBZ1326597.1 Gfo/Idh/MocA family oxidoreductase [Aquirufa aurantiipilula]